MKKTISLFIIMVLLMFLLSACSSSYSGSGNRCGWCRGLGYAAKGDGTMRTVTCSHCHGTGYR